MDSPFRSTPLELLNQFLRGELAAAATYEVAEEHVEDPEIRTVFEQCRQSHAQRAVLLSQEMKRRNEYPSETAGPWGAFAKVVERGASLFGDEGLLCALQLGELNGLDTYEAGVVSLDPELRGELEVRLLSAQRETLARINDLATRSRPDHELG